MHVDVGLGADNAVVHFKISVGAHEHTAGGVYCIAGHTDGDVKAESYGIGVSEFNLIEIAAWTEDAKVRDDSAPWADESDGFFGGVSAILVELFIRSERVAFSEEGFNSLFREVAMTRTDIDDKSVGGFGLLRKWEPHFLVNLLANHVFDNGSGCGVGLWCGHRMSS